MINFLTKIFDFFNVSLFESKLENPLFQIKPDRTTIFYFVKPNQLEIGSLFGTASSDQVIDDLLHCMIHMKNYQIRLPDYTVNQYHNQHFANQATDIGMTVQKYKSRGWATASVSSHVDVCNFLMPDEEQQRILWKLVSSIKFPKKTFLNFQSAIRSVAKSKSSRQFLLKYTCKCKPPHNTIRSGRRPDGANPLDITCNLCGEKFSHY